jgi:Zn-dependent peptidase ImmA (M78 family)
MLSPIQRAVRRAMEVYSDSQAAERVEKDGYTRVDPFRIADAAGVLVMLRPLEKLLGAFVREGHPGILVNAQRSTGLIHMTCAHELGHYFMGHGTTADEHVDYDQASAQIEQEADWFAYQLLTPRSLLASVMKRKQWTVQSLLDPGLLYQFSLRIGVSYRAAAWTLHRNRLINRAVVEQLLKTSPVEIKRGLLGYEMTDARREVWLLDDSDRASVLEPRPEDVLILRVEANAASGYLWAPDELSSQGFEVRPLGRTSSKIAELSDLVFGRRRSADFLLIPDEKAAVSNKLVTFGLVERRPWETTSSGDASTFLASARFEHLGVGLSGVAKCRLFEQVNLTT